MTYAIAYVSSLVALFLLDLLWIGVIARPLYKEAMGPLLSDHVVWWAAIAFYLIYALGLAYFVIVPSIEARSLMRAVGLGAFFGFIAYMTYDLTNIATTTGWPVSIAFIDMAWGAFASACASGAAYLLATAVFGL